MSIGKLPLRLPASHHTARTVVDGAARCVGTLERKQDRRAILGIDLHLDEVIAAAYRAELGARLVAGTTDSLAVEIQARRLSQSATSLA